MDTSPPHTAIPETDSELSEASGRDYRELLMRKRTVPYFRIPELLLTFFTPGERLVFYTCSILLGLSTLFFLAELNRAISVSIPTSGGSVVEGETGPVRFINPVLMISQADRDISEVVYSGLTRALPDGRIIPDLASAYQISGDGTTYTFTLRNGVTFHDGTPVTADDVLFTIALAQNPEVKSPRRADWEGVVAASPDPHTVVFTLPHAYTPFMENTTLGILPKHLWEKVSAEELPFSTLNTHAIGSGPYMISAVHVDQSGAAIRYDLSSFKNFALGAPYIQNLSFAFFPNQDQLTNAFNAGRIDSLSGITPGDLAGLSAGNKDLVRAPLPRVFGIFFNQNKNSALTDSAVRLALDSVIDKQTIVHNVLQGYGVVLSGPIPPGVTGFPSPIVPSVMTYAAFATSTPGNNLDAARAILQKGGWTFDATTGAWKKNKNTLAIKLSTADLPELVETAQEVATTWRALGVQTSVQVYSLSEFNNTVLRPREYEAILFGEVVGREADFFAFWHSSQRNDPGLNLSLYANSKVDSLLSLARGTTDKKQRDQLYAQFSNLVVADTPAIFLYSPEFLYELPQTIHGVEIGSLTSAAERFANVYAWYINTERVWNFFTNSPDTM